MCIYIVRFWLTALTECCDEVALHIHVHTHTAHTMYSAHKNTFRHKAEIIIVVCSVLLLIISMYGGQSPTTSNTASAALHPTAVTPSSFTKCETPWQRKYSGYYDDVVQKLCSIDLFLWFVFWIGLQTCVCFVRLLGIWPTDVQKKQT